MYRGSPPRRRLTARVASIDRHRLQGGSPIAAATKRHRNGSSDGDRRILRSWCDDDSLVRIDVDPFPFAPDLCAIALHRKPPIAHRAAPLVHDRYGATEARPPIIIDGQARGDAALSERPLGIFERHGLIAVGATAGWTSSQQYCRTELCDMSHNASLRRGWLTCISVARRHFRQLTSEYELRRIELPELHKPMHISLNVEFRRVSGF